MAKITFEEINETLDLEYFFDRESLPHHMSRGSSGMQINAAYCPKCGDQRHRVYLNADSGRGNCFVCDAKYSKITFIMATLGIADTDWSAGIKACQEVMSEQGWRPRRMLTVAVDHAAVVLPYSNALPFEDDSNLVYLESRGITGEYAKYFGLRYCEFGFFMFKDDDGKNATQTFDNRIIIPVFDLDGELKTFQGRSLAKDDPRKYLFPKGLPGTGRYLFNGQNVILTKEIAMGEGAFDVAAMKIAFDEEVSLRHVMPVGSFGKHLSYGSRTGDDQLGRLMQLRRTGVEQVTIMWDGEKRALISALDAARLITGIGMRCRIALLPADKDPNEVPGDVVRQVYNEAKLWTPALDIRWRLKNPYRVKSKVLA